MYDQGKVHTKIRDRIIDNYSVKNSAVHFSLIFIAFYDLETIIRAIIQHGFEVRYEKTYTFRPDEVESLYIKHRNDDVFKPLVEAFIE
jgi:hypothetical protein